MQLTYFALGSGEAPRAEDFMQQLQWLLGGQFGVPRPGEGPQQQQQPQPGQAGGQRAGRRTQGPSSGQAAARHASDGDVEMPDLVSDAGSSEVLACDGHSPHKMCCDLQTLSLKRATERRSLKLAPLCLFIARPGYIA